MFKRLSEKLRPKRAPGIRFLGHKAGQNDFFLQSNNVWHALVYAPPGAGMSFFGDDCIFERSFEELYDFACPDSAWDNGAELLCLLKLLFNGELGCDARACCDLLRELGHSKSQALLETLALAQTKSIARIDACVWNVRSLADLFERFGCAAEKLSIESGFPPRQTPDAAKARKASL